MRRWAVSFLSVLAFAAVMAFFPGQYLTAVLLYFVLFFGISIAMGLRAYRRGTAEAREVARGKPLLEIDEKEVNKVLEKDKGIAAEYRKMARASLMPLFTLPIFVAAAAFLFPVVPAYVDNALRGVVGDYLATFLGYLAVLSVFAILGLATYRPVQMPRIARNVKVYERGIVIDKVLGLRAPVEVKGYVVNEERKFVELNLGGQVIRIYYRDVKELDSLLSKMVVLK